MTTTVWIASVPSADTPGSCIQLHNEKRSYTFGRLAEGSQRSFTNRKIPWTSVEHVFLSGAVEWSQVGGVFGYLLSLGALNQSRKVDDERKAQERKAKGKTPHASSAREGISVHGGDNLCHVLAASRSAVYRQPFRLRTHEQRDDPRAIDSSNLKPDWEDDSIKVWKIPVKRARSSSPTKRTHSSPEPGTDKPVDEGRFKQDRVVSDPELAKMIVERCMFDGKISNHVSLIPTKVGSLKPTDVPIILKGQTMEIYRGPFGAESNKPDDIVYVVPDQFEDSANVGEDHDGLEIRSLQLPWTTYSETSMSYIVKCHDRRGKFNAPLAKSLGVKPPDFRYLTMGQNVEVEGGKIITPDMVLGDSQPGSGVIVADIASRDFLDAFLARPEWSKPELMSHIVTMYWFLMPGLAEDPGIQKFVQDHSQIKHVFCGEDTCPNMISSPGPAELQVKLRRIDPERFPLLSFDNAVKYPAPPAGSSITLGRTGSRLQLMPRVIVEDEAADPFPDLVTAAQSVGEDVLALARTAKTESTNAGLLARIEEDEQDIPNRDAEIISLGTGSSMPSKYRNVAATLVRVPGIGNYLFDCGEGTLGQIRRLCGAEETADILRNLRCIVISHLHADHHLGTTSLIKAWYEQTLKDGRNDATLAISCITRFRIFLHEISQVEDIGMHRLRFPSCPWGSSSDKLLTTSEDLGADNFGLASIKRVWVTHCFRSYATQLELTSGLRIAYSGDCRPSPNFAKACRGAHLLIHECTFGDEMASHAKAKLHSTASEALDVARQMGVRRTLLTHFSQRYMKSESLKNDTLLGEGGREAGTVLLAFDFMRVRLGDFKKAARYIPAIQQLMETTE